MSTALTPRARPASTQTHTRQDLAIADIPRRELQFNLNGTPHTVVVETWVTLLDLLRDHLGLTGTKKGCDHGQCGACTVLRNGRRINACLTLAVMQQGAQITTIEGLAGPQPDGTQPALHPLQQAFIEHDAFQCGYCTPGQLCSAAGLLNEAPPVNLAELRERMSGNLCRCGAYPQITDAVAEVVVQVHRRPADDAQGGPHASV
ncbi:(2Fe-2S)-binding protein [Caldimonas brevitalea]|uniref:(2Fe-2S)-binding protein n=1 Tax=Caldimonas brevitalea TaxID=413882 RepID=A0A0G3BR39_9BURK|nr:2Fe-2S iron-sulfur cluster-binding protein [Caldimonas brevitalea]AKJ31889.1 (2Fe-2S)-binding protein [Caldimonas brevitalea]